MPPITTPPASRTQKKNGPRFRVYPAISLAIMTGLEQKTCTFIYDCAIHLDIWRDGQCSWHDKKAKTIGVTASALAQISPFFGNAGISGVLDSHLSGLLPAVKRPVPRKKRVMALSPTLAVQMVVNPAGELPAFEMSASDLGHLLGISPGRASGVFGLGIGENRRLSSPGHLLAAVKRKWRGARDPELDRWIGAGCPLWPEGMLCGHAIGPHGRRVPIVNKPPGPFPIGPGHRDWRSLMIILYGTDWNF